MPKNSPFRSGAFRFALMLAAVFALGAMALLFVVEQSVNRYAYEVAHDTITAEVGVLADEGRSAGLAGMIRSIARRENAAREHQLRYLLVDHAGIRLAGSLPASAARIGWRNTTVLNEDLRIDDGAAEIPLMILGKRLDGGATLVVGSDISDLEELRWNLGKSSVAFGLLITLLSLVGGLLTGTAFLGRVHLVNRSVERIMQGALTERLPALGVSPELDQLSANLNGMLSRIEALMQAMQESATNIAHDLRTPLTRLRQRLETIKEGASGSALEQQVDAATTQVDEILGIFRALLRISSLESGTGPQRMIDVDLTNLMLRVVDAYRAVAEDAGHRLHDRIEAGVVGRADPEMLTQAVANLIENAILHTPSATQVTVALERRLESIVIVVADDGPGVPAVDRVRILDRFYRLDRSRGTAGAGLGLALVSAVATKHGATLRLFDNEPGLRVELLINPKLVDEA